MVIGVDRFRAHYAGHEHQYVLIGGAACDLVMDEVGLDFRAWSFIVMATTEADFEPRQFKVSLSKVEVAERLRATYHL